MSARQNLIEKIVQRFIACDPSKTIKSGDFVRIRPKNIMTHDNSFAVIKKFKSMNVQKVFDSRQLVLTIDHDIQNTSKENILKYKDIRNFAKSQGVDFYPPGRGIGHQIMIEEGYAFPNSLVVASDSHSNMYGGVGCLGTPVVRTDAAAIWATGETWWQIPPVVKVTLTGQISSPIVTGKDIIIALSGLFDKNEVLNSAVEFQGDGVKCLSIDERLTIANMTTEWGALAGLFPVDQVTIDWYRNAVSDFESHNGQFNNNDTVPSLANSRVHPRINSDTIRELEKNFLHPDDGCSYKKELVLDLSSITTPLVAGPNSVKKIFPVSSLTKDIKVDKAYLISCTNSRYSDFEDAMRAFQELNAPVHKDTKLYIAAASSVIQKKLEQSGIWEYLIKSGAIPLPSGCGPCIGLGKGLLAEGEVGISSSNRNFKGRMGSKDALAFLASPFVVASSAILGKIDIPLKHKNDINSFPRARVEENGMEEAKLFKLNKIIPGFDEHIHGEAIFCDSDNINTDAIYPGKYTYREDLSEKAMGQVVMENYDINFSKLVKKGDILVSGHNFGCGSSREQAATSLKFAGISVVIAASFSETFKRNALNNALICLECPGVVEQLRTMTKNRSLSNRPSLKLTVDFKNSKVLVSGIKKEFEFSSLGQVAQELIVEGGLENFIKKRFH